MAQEQFDEHDVCALLRQVWPDVAGFRAQIEQGSAGVCEPDTIDLLLLFASVRGVANRHSVNDAARVLEDMAAVIRHADADTLRMLKGVSGGGDGGSA
jgi:hypothetical protein